MSHFNSSYIYFHLMYIYDTYMLNVDTIPDFFFNMKKLDYCLVLST